MILAQARKLVVFVIGSTVLLLGVIMLVTPGQGILTIAAGLAILATEFVWARVLLKRMKKQAEDVVRQVTGKSSPARSDTSPPPEE